jgi:hypothetical protein
VNAKSENVDLKELVYLALGGLESMYCAEEEAFCFRTELIGDVLVKRGISKTNTLITLIGIQQAARNGFRCPFDTLPLLKNLEHTFHQMSTVGDIGLYLWLCAYESSYDRISWSIVELNAALSDCKDATHRRTMELAWFLSGLSEIAMSAAKTSDLRDIAIRTFHLLIANQETSGLFRHSSASHSVAGLLRSRIASFADQIYPIYALSRFFAAFDIAEGIEAAISCARKLCLLQGPLGQWWWHYDAIEGRVIGRYPVYSVHQDGMAPMALFALGTASGVRLDEYIYKGLRWIAGENELKIDMRNKRFSVIWRSLHLPTVTRYVDEGLQFGFENRRVVCITDLRVLFECHPYHLGWLLFAFAECARHTNTFPQ